MEIKVEQLSPSKLRAIANGEFEYWDVGEIEPFPNLGKTSIDRVFHALIRCGGRMHDSFFFNENMKRHYLSVVYRISLPVGTKKLFETLSGYKCSEPDKIQLS